jgi:hypothetical protein
MFCEQAKEGVMGRKTMTQGPRERPISVSHGKGKLPDPTYPDPQQYASHKDGMNMSGGKGPEHQVLGTGRPAGAGGIQHVPPGKGSGKALGMTSGPAKGVPQPFNDKDTRKG